MSHVVVAPDKFKGTLTAAQVAAHVAAGLGRACPGVKTVQVPVADGGDGTVDAAEAAGYRRVDIGVRGPTGVGTRLLGPCGAAAVYAPQKGASPQDVPCLEEGLARWADVTERSFGFVKRNEPSAGAAGGLGFAALGFLGAAVQPGIELLLDLLAFTDRLPGAC